MSEVKHTPAPWETRYSPHQIEVWSPTASHVVTQVYLPPAVYEREEANARLIASAPDLLTALEGLNQLVADAQAMLTEHLRPGGRFVSESTLIYALLYHFDGPRQRDVQGATKAAISKAKGDV